MRRAYDRQRRRVEQAMFGMAVVAAILGIAFGYYLASTDANQQCKDAYQRYSAVSR